MLQPGTREYEQAKGFVEQWKLAGPVLEAERERSIRESDTVRAMRNLSGMMAHAIREHPPLPESGLVEAQRWFMLARSRQTRGEARAE